MAKLIDISITAFEANESHGAYVSVGGTAAKVLRDGSVGEQRVEPHTVSTDKFLSASRKLLAPQLNATLEQGHAALARFQESMKAINASAVEAHKTFSKEMSHIFSASSGRATNHTLTTSTEASTGATFTVNHSATAASGYMGAPTVEHRRV